MDSNSRLRGRVARTCVGNDAVNKIHRGGAGRHSRRRPSHLVRQGVREGGQPLCLRVRLERGVADGGSDTIEPGTEVLAPRSGEGGPVKLLCVQAERCNLRAVLSLGQSTGKGFAFELVVETNLVAVFVRPRERQVQRETTSRRGRKKKEKKCVWWVTRKDLCDHKKSLTKLL